ncbi:MAG: thioredoxin domain-containing protein [Endozoicomonas sp.]|uniref:thioredoxin domain-containing protein n=1 Tax=Endozoicomonas sp. TaxID=1892382 RepID=UPI003D9B66C8
MASYGHQDFENQTPLVRLQSLCPHGHYFHSSHCDCDEQRDLAMEMLVNDSTGGFLVMAVGERHAGRGIGHVMIAGLYSYGFSTGRDVVTESFNDLGFHQDERDFSASLQVLSKMGISRIRLTTNNPDKVSQVENSDGISVEEVAPRTDRAINDVINDIINDVREELLKAESVSKEEVKSVYEQYKNQIGRPLEEIEVALTQQLQQQKQKEKVLALIEKVKKETGFINKLEKPEPPTFSMDLSPYPFKGPKDAQITVVEFADYNCGYCRNSKPEIDKLLKQYGDQVKFYYIDYPVTEKGVAGSTTQTARGAYCAGQQDKFWDFYNLAYEQAVTMETASELAKTLKLDAQAFNACLASDESAEFVKNSEKMAQDLGVTGTPTLFVNGQLLHTHDAGKDLKAELEKLLPPKS